MAPTTTAAYYLPYSYAPLQTYPLALAPAALPEVSFQQQLPLQYPINTTYTSLLADGHQTALTSGLNLLQTEAAWQAALPAETGPPYQTVPSIVSLQPLLNERSFGYDDVSTASSLMSLSFVLQDDESNFIRKEEEQQRLPHSRDFTRGTTTTAHSKDFTETLLLPTGHSFPKFLQQILPPSPSLTMLTPPSITQHLSQSQIFHIVRVFYDDAEIRWSALYRLNAHNDLREHLVLYCMLLVGIRKAVNEMPEIDRRSLERLEAFLFSLVKGEIFAALNKDGPVSDAALAGMIVSVTYPRLSLPFIDG